MSPIDQLPADQRAVLQLLLVQGKSYDDLAQLLQVDRHVVRERARAAVEALGPGDGDVPPPDRRGPIADYLLGQQAVSERAATRARLEASAPDRAWARIVSSELRPFAREGLPEVPAEAGEVDEAFDALKARTAAREHARRSSRLGGVLLLAGLGVVLAVVLVILLGGGDDDGGNQSASTRPATTATNGSTQVLSQVNLEPAQNGSRALGVGQVVRRNGSEGVVLQAQGLPKCGSRFAYAVWLYNSPSDAVRLGFVKSDNPRYDACLTQGNRLVAVSGLPSDASRYKRLIITRETASDPDRPGRIVLSGSLSVGA